MNTIKCKNCGQAIEIDKALEGQIEARVLASEHKKHEEEIEKVRLEAQDKAKEQATAKVQTKLSQLEEQSVADKLEAKELREQLSELMTELREERKTAANAKLDMQKKLIEEEKKIIENAQKDADDKQRLKIAEKDKQLEAAKKQVEEMQRKLNQGSQQMQGEILELDLEESLSNTFRDDIIEPIAKGVNGADINQKVRSQSGIECGVILWELKRTKNWVDGWIPKLKTDLRNAKANIPVIVSEVLPKNIDGDMGLHEGVWICKPKLTIVLATLLRKSLLDVGREKLITQNRGSSTEALYNFITSHEFSQQIESMIETYQEMTTQVVKERVVYEKLWAQREKQASKLLLGTANIIGGMQGQIGSGSMPKIKGLEIDLIDMGE